MLTDLLLGFVVSLSFLAGGLLYSLTKEELDALKLISFEKSMYILAIPFGIFLAVVMPTPLKPFVSLLIFLVALASESLAYRNKDKKYAIKESIKHTIAFFALFSMFYLLNYFFKY